MPDSLSRRRTRRTSDSLAGNHGESFSLQFIRLFIRSHKGRVAVVLSCLLVAKLAVIAVPLLLKQIIDRLDSQMNGADNLSQASAPTFGTMSDVWLLVPVLLLLAYGAARIVSSLFSELRDALFARVRFRSMRRLSAQVVAHLHTLSLRFHLRRKIGEITRDLDRGTLSVSTLLNYMVFYIIPVSAELLLVLAYLFIQYAAYFGSLVLFTLIAYVVFTFMLSNWRIGFRHRMNELDSQANSLAVDSVLNYETVKYFNNEDFERRRYTGTLREWEDVAVKSQATMSLLNFGQSCIIALGITLIMIGAARGVALEELSIGDFVLINTMMLQLFLPLSTLGIIYRALRYALVDMKCITQLLASQERVIDVPQARDLTLKGGEVRFDHVHFAYQPGRPVLNDLSFHLPAGKTLAIVGPSGAGKSSIVRLLFRFYDVAGGRITIDDQSIGACTQESVRHAIGIVPQDTVLFNESLRYNIAYARPDASVADIAEAARLAGLEDFIASLPERYDTVVGERGLKLSGGEKQKVAIARVILKRPGILVFDEATSSLDSRSERRVLKSLRRISRAATTLMIAHRLSTVADADRILVLDQGRIVEQGQHRQLVEANGLYAHLWHLQKRNDDMSGGSQATGGVAG